MVLAGRLPPAAMFPAGRPELRAIYLQLASGLRVRAVECGKSDAPVVLLVPGWACPAYVFRENLVPIANAGYRVIAVELKGHGLSDKPLSPAEYRLGEMRVHVTQILDALEASSAIVCGLSMGAALGAHVAVSSPERVRALVMVSPVGFLGVPGLRLARVATGRLATPLFPRLAGRWLIETLLAIVNGKLRQITDSDVDEYWAPTQFPEFILAMRHLLHEFNWDAPFTPMNVPTLLVTGSRDRFVSRAAVESYRRIMPAIRHIEVRNAGHVVYDEAAPIVNDAMLEFFQRASGERPA